MKEKKIVRSDWSGCKPGEKMGNGILKTGVFKNINRITLPSSNYEIWIAEDVAIHCRAKPRWWHKFFIKLFFGWEYKEK